MSIASAAPCPSVPGWPSVFRGSDAVRAGLVTKGQLRGARFDRLFPDIYIKASAKPPDLARRSAAAFLWSRRRGVLAGYSAAEILDASCGPLNAPASLIVPGSDLHPPPGLDLHRDTLLRDEVQSCGWMNVTTPLRTAFDLARWCADPVEAVLALDALARKGGFPPAAILHLAAQRPGVRGVLRLPMLIARADPRAGSPMETRIRLLLIDGGLPAPVLQHPVQDPVRRRAVWLDLAYPELRIGIEYEGDEHTRPERVLRDAGRYTNLVDDGWRIYRFTKYEIFDEPDEIVAKIRRALETAPRAPRT